MNEKHVLNEQQLETVTGGADSADFERVWTEFARTHCGRCMFQTNERDTFCVSARIDAAASYAAGGAVECRAFAEPC